MIGEVNPPWYSNEPSVDSPDRAERLVAKTIRRLKHAKLECEAHLPHVINVDTIIQAGIGHWLEGPYLLEKFPNATYVGIDPITRYIKTAMDEGYPGEITLGCAWHKSGETLTFEDRRDRSSVFVLQNKRHPIVSPTYTLDDLYGSMSLGSVFLWMDCEGSESHVLNGAKKILESSNYVLTEARHNQKKGYAHPDDVFSRLVACGFHQVSRYKCTSLFVM